MSEFLEHKRREIDQRIAELKPVVEEYSRLRAAQVALAEGPSGPAAAERPERRQARRTPRGAGVDRAISLVVQLPGITIPELAARMQITRAPLYRVMPTLQKEGAIVKEGRGWHLMPGQDPVAIIKGDEVWCPTHEKYHRPPSHPTL